MNFNDTKHLSRQMEQKHDLLVQLRDLGLMQIELIKRGDMSRLLKVLAAKQRLIPILQSIDRELDPFRNQDPQARQWETTADRQQCAQNAAQCEELLQAIVEQERESEARMTVRRDEVATQLQGMHNTAAVHQAYHDDNLPQHNQLDLTSQG
ncbi:MAG: hypothetical protein SGJ20_18595 [Planctomycetota bacterium]|nr:hypothetical protein [Planctomycetota bacterium]